MNINENPKKERFGTSRDFEYDTDYTNLCFLFEELPLLPAAEGNGKGFSSNAKNGVRKRYDLKGKLVRFTARVLALTGFLSYVALGYFGVLYVREKGLIALVAEGFFGGVRTRVESILSDKKPDEQITPEENSAIAENVTVKNEDLSCSAYGEVYNETDYNLKKITVPASAVPKFDKDSAVLIIHTHGTESYLSENGVSVDGNFRSKDLEENMIAVGTAFAEILEQRGIKYYHCTEMFDRESYIDAYARSGEAVRKYMREHPDISYVIDIHRDAVIRSDGTVIKTIYDDAAQLMIVCGTDEMGADFPAWHENFAFGKEYQRKLFENYPGLVRHMNLRSASFNQQLCERYLLLEVGTCGNTLSEAIKAAEKGAEVFADLITGK